MIKQRGVALIVVLLLLAMMTTLAIQMTERLHHDFYRVENQVLHQQGYWYTQGMESLAEVAIKRSFDDNDTVNLSQVWAIKGQRYPLEGGDVIGDIVDKQACFNLNAFSSVVADPLTTTKPFLVRYFQMVLEELGIDSYESESLADHTWEFIDADTDVQSSLGGEDNLYESFSPPYLAPNNWLADISEWRAINGVTAQLYQKMSPLLCTLPTSKYQLNINTLDQEHAVLLMALFAPELSLSDAESVLKSRPYDGWGSVDDFLKDPALVKVSESVRTIGKEFLSVSSQYFELDAEVMVDRARARIVALMKYNNKRVTVVRRHYGGSRERMSGNSAE